MLLMLALLSVMIQTVQNMSAKVAQMKLAMVLIQLKTMIVP